MRCGEPRKLAFAKPDAGIVKAERLQYLLYERGLIAAAMNAAKHEAEEPHA